MSETKIPFGRCVTSKKLVDVREVPRGANCGCICPGCELPLLAKHCKVGRVDHFAHHTRGQDKKVLEECTFSFWVSLAAMARQIFSEAQTMDLALPEYSYRPDTLWGSPSDEHFVCTSAQTITLGDIAINKVMFGETFDVVGSSKDVPVCIKFIHPEKMGIPDLSGWDYKHHRAVVLIFDISSVVAKFQHSDVPLKDTLAKFLRIDVESKEWIYHPRMAHKLEIMRRKKNIGIAGRTFEPKSPSRSAGTTISGAPQKMKAGQSQLYRNAQGEYLFYCRRCDHQILRNAKQCFCDRCEGTMYRIHAYQANVKSI